MLNAATIEKIETTMPVNVVSRKLSAEQILKSVALTMAIFLGMFTLGIFVTKGIIELQLVHGIEIEKLVTADTGATVILAGLIAFCGYKGALRSAITLGAIAALVSGAVAYAVSCVVFAC